MDMTEGLNEENIDWIFSKLLSKAKELSDGWTYDVYYPEWEEILDMVKREIYDEVLG